MLRCGLGETKPLALARAEEKTMVCVVGESGDCFFRCFEIVRCGLVLLGGEG